MNKKEEILFWRKGKRILKNAYGGDCKISDLDDFPEAIRSPKNKPSEVVIHPSRCVSCRTSETLSFIEERIELLKFMP